MKTLYGSRVGRIWIDVENYQWSTSLSKNQDFIVQMVKEVVKYGGNPGIYTNYYNWQSIVGLGFSGVSQYPLWYAHYDGMLQKILQANSLRRSQF